MAEEYVGGDIKKIKIPELKPDSDLNGIKKWGKEAWEFLENLKHKNGKSTSEYNKTLERLKKILTNSGSSPENGGYFSKFHGNKDLFVKELEKYIKKGKDKQRKKKIEGLLKHYKEKVATRITYCIDYSGENKNIANIKVPEFENEEGIMNWGAKAWEFLRALKSRDEEGVDTYNTLIKNLEKILTVVDMGPETGTYFMKHNVGQEDLFSKELKNYIENGTNLARQEKIEDLRKYYKDTILKEQADLIMSNNAQLSDNKDGRGFTGMKVIILRGEAWKNVKLPEGKDEGPFQNLTSLKRLVLGPEVKEIGPNCFKGCKNLKTIEVEGPGDAIVVGENAFNGCEVTKVKGDKERTKNLCDIMKKILAGKNGTIGSAESKSARKPAKKDVKNSGSNKKKTANPALSSDSRKSTENPAKKDVKDSGSDKSNVLEQLPDKKKTADPALSSDSRKSTENQAKKDVKNSGSDKSNVLEQLSNKRENVGFGLLSSKLKSVQKFAKKS